MISKVPAESIARQRASFTALILPRSLVLKGGGQEGSCGVRASCSPLRSTTQQLWHVLLFARTCTRPLSPDVLTQDSCRRNKHACSVDALSRDALSRACPCVPTG